MTDYRTAKGWLTEAERELLVRLAQEVPALGNILNIGLEYGASFHCLRTGSHKNGVSIDAVDLDTSKFVGDVDPSDPVEFIERDSKDFYAGLVNSSVARDIEFVYHLVFVDGDHRFAAVKADARFADFIPADGVIVFHDCYDLVLGKPHPHPWNPDGNDAVQEWYEAHQGEWEEGETVDSIRWFRRIA